MHIGIIPDGNRRWCKKNNIKYKELVSHWINNMFIQNLKLLINNLNNYKIILEISNISLYVSSIDNIYRDDKTHELGFELIRKIYNLYTNIDNIDNLSNTFTVFEKKKLYNTLKDFKINIIGDINLLPQDIQDIINHAKNILTGSKHSINIAIAYDYNKDILSASQENCDINYIRTQSNIDLVFRPGGEKRLSGFFPTKTIYSEFYFIDKLFPDINLDDICIALQDYKNRNRRYGK
jgi:undecaprenyl diphosphate synthase